MGKLPSFNPGAKRNRSSIRTAAAGESVPRAEIPGTVSLAKVAFFRANAARYVGKEGAVVDLGCWLGSTSIALAQGILDQGSRTDQPTEEVLGFDRFVWGWMPADIPFGHYHPGESFLPEARRLVRDHGRDGIELIQADLTLYKRRGSPINILLVDAMKSEGIASRITTSFFPGLIPGGLLVHQDFEHYYNSWIHVIQYRPRRFFRRNGSVPRMGTVAFEVIEPIPREAADRATDLVTILDDEIDASFPSLPRPRWTGRLCKCRGRACHAVCPSGTQGPGFGNPGDAPLTRFVGQQRVPASDELPGPNGVSAERTLRRSRHMTRLRKTAISCPLAS